MCIRPILLPTGVRTSCHECWQCIERGINDWVGRCIAETKTAKATYAVTLTYGRNEHGDADHVRSALLTYSDVQKYLKLLRRHGYPVRYLVAGEYGERKGRAHWHMILFFQDQVPPHELDRNFIAPYWQDEHRVSRGFSYWSKPEHHAIRYVCKYVQKELRDPTHQGKLVMSKKPPLGMAYFADLARRYAEQHLAPQTLDYSFPGVMTKRNGREELCSFRLKDRMAELYLQAYLDAWKQLHGNKPWPNSELVDLFAEYGRVVTDENRLPRRVDKFDLREAPRQALPFKGPTDLASWEHAFNQEFDENGHAKGDYLKRQRDARAERAARLDRAKAPDYWSGPNAPRNFNEDGTFRWPEPKANNRAAGAGPGDVPGEP